jgi:hypothetical protein
LNSDKSGDPRLKARLYRIARLTFVFDIAAGLALYLLADLFPVAGEVFGLAVIEFVGITLMAVGGLGFLWFAALARRAAGD